MARLRLYLLLPSLLLPLSSCGGTETDLAPDAALVPEPAKFATIDSPRSFQEASDQEGNATGIGWGKSAVSLIDGSRPKA